MPAKVILNPYANRWQAGKQKPEAEAALKAAGVEFEIAITEGPGHGSELAAQAVQEGYQPIISAGGDGSISEVMNGIMQAVAALGTTHSLAADQQPVLGILPLGSANDLVVNLGLPRDLSRAAQVIAAGKTRPIDLGRVAFTDLSSPEKPLRQRYFDNNSALGLEPSITLIQQQIQRVHGPLRYLLATLRGVLKNPQWQMRLEWEGGSYEGMVNMVTIGNNPLTGGLFYMTPHAIPDDGLLTFVYGAIPTRLQILRLLPKTMKPGAGSYVEHPSVNEVNTPWLRIWADRPSPLHTDGEIQSEQVQEAEYQIMPRALPVLAP